MKLFLTAIFLFSLTFVRAMEADSSGVIEIYLVRHARVDLKKPLLCSQKQAVKTYRQYNEMPVQNFDADSVLKFLPQKLSTVYASNLPRAIQTAKKLYPEADTIVTNHVFNEYPLTMVSIPLVWLPYPVWTTISRFLWWSRLNYQKEPRGKSIRRMEQATLEITNLAQKRGRVVVVCHGYLISDIRNQLRKEGWFLQKNGGNHNLSVSKFTKSFTASK